MSGPGATLLRMAKVEVRIQLTIIGTADENDLKELTDDLDAQCREILEDDDDPPLDGHEIKTVEMRIHRRPPFAREWTGGIVGRAARE